MRTLKVNILVLLFFAACCMCSAGCGPIFRGVTGAAQSANLKQVTVEYGVTTPEDVVSIVGEPDEEGSYPGKPATYYLKYKTLFAWRGIEVTWCVEGRCKTYDYSHEGVNKSGTITFSFYKGKAYFDKALVPEYQRAK